MKIPQGEGAFYEGRIAKNLVRELKGAVSEDDLRSYEVVEREATEANVQNFRVSVNRRVLSRQSSEIFVTVLVNTEAFLNEFCPRKMRFNLGMTRMRNHQT